MADREGTEETVFRKARTARASEDVVAQVRKAFFAGMKPGDWLGTESQLAETFGVSRITVRDAIRSLEALGIVEVKVGARGGLRIADADPDRFADALSIQLHLMGIRWEEVTEAMRAIEPLTASLAARRATAEDIAGLRALVARSREARADPARFTALALDFHLVVAESAGNRALRSSVRALRSAQELKFRPNTSPEIAARVARMHGDIVDAIEARDPERASAAMLAHLERVTRHPQDHRLEVC